MIIQTKAHGRVKINPADIITFENGLIGFEEKKKFVLLGNPKVNEILIWLQSLEDQNLAFAVIQPRVFKPDYNPAVSIKELEDLEVEDAADLLVYAIVFVPADVRKMTANLRAPVIIKVKKNKGKQIVLDDDTFKIKEYVLPQEQQD